MPRGRPRKIVASDESLTTSTVSSKEAPVAPKKKKQASAETASIVRTSAVIMKLQKIVAEKTGGPWFNVLKIKPFDSENPSSDFVVEARTPFGNEWMGQYPANTDDEQLGFIADELIAFQEEMKAQKEQAATMAMAMSGVMQSPDEVEGKTVELNLANRGMTQIKVRKHVVVESETQEAARLQREIKKFPIVSFISERGDDVIWNGLRYTVHPGPNELPKPIVDEYFKSRQAWLDAQARQHQTLKTTDGGDPWVMGQITQTKVSN